jgi:hypothetical protein
VRFATWPMKVARLVDGINNNSSTLAKHSAGPCDDQTGFGMSTHTWSTPNRFATQAPSARIPNVSVA